MPDQFNPWDRRGKKRGSELDQLLAGLKKFFGDKKAGPPPFGGNGGDEGPTPGPRKFNLGLVILLLVAGLLISWSVYQIQPGEQGVVLRFGQFYQTTGSGLNFLIPFIDQIIKVDVESIRKEQFGASGEGLSGKSSAGLESLMLTADKNVIQISWVVQYKIRDPEAFLFNIENPRAAVRDAGESVVRRLVGNRDFNYVLNNRNELAQSTMKEMQILLDKYDSGIQLVVLQLQDVNPPDAVRPSFNDVNEAEQDMIRLANEAEKEANAKIPKAKGTANKVLEQAQGYAIERTNNAKGETARFNAIYTEYQGAKEVTRTRMYIETLSQVLPQLQEVVVIDQTGKGMIPLLNLTGQGQTPKPQP